MFYIGADYYPEHWPRERWPKDAKMMRKCGFNVVRMAEFAWSKLEPSDGAFDFSWLDKAIEELAKEGIKAILGTPTGAPPAWLIEKHPDILPILKDKSRMEFGRRRHYCINNEACLKYGRRIVEKMAKHYKDNKNVIGMQVDNELGHPRCYCENCRRKFQEWLKKKYGSLEKLNKAWGTIFWSQEYTSWDQIPLPWIVKADYVGVNPSLFLDFYRFFSDCIVKYSDMQIKILKQHSPDKFVMHNLMGLFDQVDYYEFAKKYDFISWDTYPTEKTIYLMNALAHDVMRGIKKKNFWVMEQQISYVTRTGITHAFAPGEMRLWTYQSIAHGADSILYFRWRACLFGDEQYHSGILQHDGTDKSIYYKEAKKITEEITKLSDLLEGSRIEATVAIIYDYDNLWSLQSYRDRYLFDPVDVMLRFYRSLKRLGINVDIVHPNGDLSPYRVAIAPLLLMIDDENKDNFCKYVEGGGHLVATFRTGIKDRSNRMISEELPGKLKDLFGITIHTWDTLRGAEEVSLFQLYHPSGFYPRFVDCEIARETSIEGCNKPFIGKEYKADTFADLIEPKTARVLARYNHGWHSGYAAVTCNEYGAGEAIYLGTNSDDKFYYHLMKWQLEEAKVHTFEVPSGVEVAIRSKDEKKTIFLMNFNDREAIVNLKQKYFEVLSEETVPKKIVLEVNGVRVLTSPP